MITKYRFRIENYLNFIIRGNYFMLILLVSFNVFNVSSQGFEGGAFAGFTGSQVDGDTYSGYNKLGFVGGIYVKRALSEKTSLKMEFKYIMKGAAKKVTNADPNVYSLTLNYFELPLLFEYKTVRQLSVEAGLAVGYLWLATIKYNDGSGFPDPPYNTLDYSGILGVYYYFNEKWAMNIRFAYSLIPIQDLRESSSALENYTNVKYNNLLSMSVYYKFQ